MLNIIYNNCVCLNFRSRPAHQSLLPHRLLRRRTATTLLLLLGVLADSAHDIVYAEAHARSFNRSFQGLDTGSERTRGETHLHWRTRTVHMSSCRRFFQCLLSHPMSFAVRVLSLEDRKEKKNKRRYSKEKDYIGITRNHRGKKINLPSTPSTA